MPALVNSPFRFGFPALVSWFNPLTPRPAITGRDEPWPFFHATCDVITFDQNWHHWSIVNFCRRKKSFQWCPGQSDWLYEAWDMHKNAQIVEWKTRSKISCQYTWLLHGQICPSQWRFLGSFFFNCRQAQHKANHCSKKKRKGEKGTAKNNKDTLRNMGSTIQLKLRQMQDF